MNCNVKLAYVSCLKLWFKDELCYRDEIGLVILLVMIVLWCYSLSCVELWVDGKTLMISYEEDLVSLRISIFTSNCDYLWLSHDLYWITYVRMIGWYDVELKYLDYVARLIKGYVIWGWWWPLMCLDMIRNANVLTTLIWIVMEGIILIQFLLIYLWWWLYKG